MNKPFYQSKTVWFNGLTVLVVVATMFGYTPNQQIAEITSTFLMAMAPVINLILRSVTKSGITIKE